MSRPKATQKDLTKDTSARLTGAEKARLRQIRKDNPVYFDKIIRDLHGAPPSRKKPEGPAPRNKKAKPSRVLLSKGGSVSKSKKVK